MIDRVLIALNVYSDRVIAKYSDHSTESVYNRDLVDMDLSTITRLSVCDMKSEIGDVMDTIQLDRLESVTIVNSDIRPELISKMTKIKTLTIERYGMDLDCIEWSDLIELDTLTIKKCDSLYRVPNGIDLLPKLERLNILDCRLSSVDAINTNIRHLDLSNNLITYVSECSPVLVTLVLSHNRLTRLDPSISKAITLKILDVSCNPIGDVHYSMIPTTVLVLIMRMCHLSITDETIRRLHDHVEILDLRDNDIDYSTPDDRFVYV